MTVESATSDTQATPAAVVDGAIAAAETAAPSEDAQLESAWAKLHPEERVERENGKFVSADPEKRAAAEAAKQTPLEGGEGEGQPVDTSTVTTDVPLPANWVGKDALWAKLPADARVEIAAHQAEQHAKLSDMGRKVSAYEPLAQAASEFAEYFNANLKGADGKPIHPADGVRYLANIQRMMDKDAPSTILSIIDTYGARDKVAAALGVKAEPGAQPAAETNVLQQTISRLEATIRELTDPQRIEQVVERKTARTEHDKEVSRLEASKPLYSKIDQADMVFFIQKAKRALGNDASVAQVFDHAYNAAIEADPTLRAQSQAAKTAAEDAAKKAEAAKRGASVNVTSTATGRPRQQSEDDAMEEVWRKHH